MRSLAILSILTIVAAAPALASADGPRDGRRAEAHARTTRTSGYAGARQAYQGRGQQARSDRAQQARNDRARPARRTVTRPARDAYANGARDAYSRAARNDGARRDGDARSSWGQVDRSRSDRADRGDRGDRDRRDGMNRDRREWNDRARRDRNERRIAAASTVYYPATYTPVPASYGVPSGAIAYSPSTGQIGWAYAYTSLAEAESMATARCGYGDCTVVAWEQGQYAAFAVGPGGAWGAASGLTTWSAEQKALASCGYDGAECHIVRWIYQ